MTPRQEAFYYCSLAYVYANTRLEKGDKTYKRANTCLLKVMDSLAAKLTEKQKAKVINILEKDIKTKMPDAFDYQDYIARAMDIIRKGKERKLNSLLTLAVLDINEEEVS